MLQVTVDAIRERIFVAFVLTPMQAGTEAHRFYFSQLSHNSVFLVVIVEIAVKKQKLALETVLINVC